MQTTPPPTNTPSPIRLSLWTYRRNFSLDGLAYRVEIRSGLHRLESRLFCANTLLASDITDVMQAGGQRNHQLQHTLADGRSLQIETGYINWVNIGVRVRANDALVHESHPGRVIRFPLAASQDPEKAERLHAEQAAQWQRNKYSLYVDIALAVLFFALAKATDNLPLSAILTAVAGLAVVVVQRFVKVDLLGGLAMFGVVMLLISAGFSYAFNDDWAVKMKSTILGSFVAVLMLSDGVFNRGGYFGKRLARFMSVPVDAQRLALGMGVLGAVGALSNWLVAKLVPTSVWLHYTTYGDFIVVLLLFFFVLKFAKKKDGELGG
jgi:intracellular septation protein A